MWTENHYVNQISVNKVVVKKRSLNKVAIARAAGTSFQDNLLATMCR